MATVGAILSTTNVVLGPAEPAKLPAASLAVPAAMEIPTVPFPLIPLMVTVLVAVPAPVTLMVPVAVPVVFKLTLALAKVTADAPV
jgi:hypothetical protein